MSVILERKGHDVDVANDGDEGHDAIANGSYDGIVMDIMMPGRSGTELLSEMRAAGDETPVLLLTAKTSLDDKVSGLELGADDYITKPFEMRELVARIDAMSFFLPFSACSSACVLHDDGGMLSRRSPVVCVLCPSCFHGTLTSLHAV